MVVKYTYFTNDKPILITNKTQKLTPYSWKGNNKMYDIEIIKFFYDECLKIEKPFIIDIGAQTGLFTLLAKYLPGSKFYAYEPFTDCYLCLNDNIKLNNINNVETFNIGLSDKVGISSLKVPTHKGLCTLSNNPMRFENFEEVDVKLDTLDNIF